MVALAKSSSIPSVRQGLGARQRILSMTSGMVLAVPRFSPLLRHLSGSRG